MDADIHAEFRKCLVDISFARAGWDYELRPAQKASEASMSADRMTRARQIWAENENQRDELRAVFRDAQPLVEMREIERAP